MVNLNLINYIKGGLEKGYNQKELNKILKESGWSEEEITEALNSMSKPKKVSSPLEKKVDKDTILIDFINKSLAKKIPEEQIKQALMAKSWPLEKINSAFSKVVKPKPAPVEQRIEEPQPIKESKRNPEMVGEGFGVKQFFLYLMWFVIISMVLTATVGVFYYVKAMSQFTVIDPNTGEEVKGYCLEQDCSDMREYVQNSLMDSLIIILTIAISISLALVIIHHFIPNREMFIWLMNILLFLFICYILYTWFTAYNKTFLN
jgi:hypothetical protein